MTEEEIIRRKIGELYLLMTRMPEFQSVEFYDSQSPKELRRWLETKSALSKWVEDE